MFQDATWGSSLDREIAYRHNREQRVYLPGYIFKWFCITCVLLYLTGKFDHVTSSIHQLLVVLFGVFTAASFVLTVVIAAIYLMLVSDIMS